MTPEELARELGEGTLRPAYLVAGAEPLLRDDAVAAIREAVVAGDAGDWNFDRLDGASVGVGALADALRTLPVMAERRLVWLREPEAGRGAKALAEALADEVAALVKSGDGTVVLLVTASKADKRSRWVKAFAKSAALVACDPPKNARGAVGFVKAEAKRQGLTLESGVAEALAENVGPQLLLLRGELAKAALHAGIGERVTRADVAASSTSLAEEPVWDLTDAIGEGRSADALAVLGRLMAGGAAPPMVLGSLASHFRKLTRAQAGARLPGSPWAAQKIEGQASRYTANRLVQCLRAIGDVDQILKGRGGIDGEVAMQRLVLGLAS